MPGSTTSTTIKTVAHVDGVDLVFPTDQLPTGTGSGPSRVGPETECAFCEDEAVSVLIRVDYAVLLDPQRQALDRALALLSDGPGPTPALSGQVARGGAGLSADTAKMPAPLSPSGGKAAVFDGYVAKCAKLSAAAQPASNSAARMAVAAKETDAAFAASRRRRASSATS
jgi:hypothetical protein